jgi:hypothetical protein
MSVAPKVAVVYYSSTGTVHQLAEAVARGAREEGAEVRLLRVPELAPAEAIAANPAWGAHVAAGYTDQIKFVDGNPYGTSHVAGQGDIPVDDTARAAAAYQGKRVATVTAQLLSGRAAMVS